jgi:nucleotide-binding universal stress UspA family protein
LNLKGEDDRMSIFPTKILFAIDGSRDAEVAATTAVGLARATGSELYVVTAAEEYPHYEAYWPLAERSRQLAQEILHKQLKRIEKLGGTVDQNYLRIGTAAEEVVSLAEEIGAGLIVLGSRGRGGVRRALMGSVSDSVVRHAHCTVVVVRGEPVVFPTKILVATDASEEAHLAATTAADVAERTGSELHVVHVGKANTRGAYSGVEVGPLPGIHQDELDKQAEGLSEAEVERMEASDTKVAGSHLRRGRADEQIVVLAEEIGAYLVVMGSRGLGRIRRALLGSASDSVVRHAHCPVMVVRPDKGRA